MLGLVKKIVSFYFWLIINLEEFVGSSGNLMSAVL